MSSAVTSRSSYSKPVPYWDIDKFAKAERERKRRPERQKLSTVKTNFIIPARVPEQRFGTFEDILQANKPVAAGRIRKSRQVAGHIVTDLVKISLEPMPTHQPPIAPEPLQLWPKSAKVIKKQASLDTFDRRRQPRYDQLEVKLKVKRPYSRSSDSASSVRSPSKASSRSVSDAAPSSRSSSTREVHAHPKGYREIEIVETYELVDSDSGSAPSSRDYSAHSGSSHSSRTRHAAGHAGDTSDNGISNSDISPEDSISQAGSRPARRLSPKVSSPSATFVSSSDRSSRSSSHYNAVGKRGRTKMPKRLVREDVLIEFGYEYESEENFFMIKRAMTKEDIDAVIRRSEEPATKKTTRYIYPIDEQDQHDEYEEVPEGLVKIRRTEWINPAPDRDVPRPHRPEPVYVLPRAPRLPAKVEVVLKDERGEGGRRPRSPKSASSNTSSQGDDGVVIGDHRHMRYKEHIDRREYREEYEDIEKYYPAEPRHPVRIVEAARENMVEYRPRYEDAGQDESGRSDSSAWRRPVIRVARDGRESTRPNPRAVAFLMSTLL